MQAVIWNSNKPAQQIQLVQAEIIQNSAVELIARFLDETTWDPIDLTGVISITTCFENDDGTELSLSLSAGIAVFGDPKLGKVKVSLTPAQALALAITDQESIEFAVKVFGATNPVKVQIPAAYKVVLSGC